METWRKLKDQNPRNHKHRNMLLKKKPNYALTHAYHISPTKKNKSIKHVSMFYSPIYSIYASQQLYPQRHEGSPDSTLQPPLHLGSIWKNWQDRWGWERKKQGADVPVAWYDQMDFVEKMQKVIAKTSWSWTNPCCTLSIWMIHLATIVFSQQRLSQIFTSCVLNEKFDTNTFTNETIKIQLWDQLISSDLES